MLFDAVERELDAMEVVHGIEGIGRLGAVRERFDAQEHRLFLAILDRVRTTDFRPARDVARLMAHWADLERWNMLDSDQRHAWLAVGLTLPDGAIAPPRSTSSGPVPRRVVPMQRQLRSTAVTDYIKALYDYRCQVCDVRLEVPGATAYAEGAHIRALGRPHHGPDTVDNVLCLCPNDHVRFDRGAIVLDAALMVIEVATQRVLGALRVDPAHQIDLDHVLHHRNLWI